MARTNIIFTTL